MASSEDLAHALAAANLAELAAHADALARGAIRLRPQPSDAAGGAVGASRLGGQPDMPAGVAWPAKQDTPMAFVGQIRLEEVAPYDSAHLLPPSGLLSFFYDAAQETYGGDPADRAGFRVVHFTGDAATLQRQPFPPTLLATARFQPCALTFASELTIAPSPPLEIPGLAWTPEQQRRYEAATAAVLGEQPSRPKSQMLGFPNQLQDDMRLECQLASHGVSVDAAASDPRTATLSPGASNWELLLQVDSEPAAGMQWADAGMLYYWVERDALRAGAVDDAWVVLQSD